MPSAKRPRFTDTQLVARQLANSGSLAYSDLLRAVSRRLPAASLKAILQQLQSQGLVSCRLETRPWKPRSRPVWDWVAD